MAELPNKCFAKQSKLKHLQMDFNQIANITNETFFGLKSLTHLSLRGNLLTSLNDELVSLTEVSSNQTVCSVLKYKYTSRLICLKVLLPVLKLTLDPDFIKPAV